MTRKPNCGLADADLAHPRMIGLKKPPKIPVLLTRAIPLGMLGVATAPAECRRDGLWVG
jgi:hypothetical protein